MVALSRGVTVELWDLSDVLSEPSEDDDEEEEEEEMPSVPTFTNQPADPRLTPLHGHNDVGYYLPIIFFESFFLHSCNILLSYIG